MSSPQLVNVIFLTLCFSFFLTEANLSLNYYDKKCPEFLKIIRETITDKQITNPSTAAGTLRLFFHDCIHNGCDGSILVSSTPFNKAERDADINLSLPGDAFDVIVRAKTALELTCPNVVSCTDILTVATRDLVSMVGGPYYDVYLGRKDGKVSKAALVEGTLPRPTMSMDEIVELFESKGFSVQEMVALSGAHTIGFSHCSELSQGIYNYSTTSSYDEHYNPRFAQGLQKACADHQNNPTLAVFNDIMTPNKFDNMYYQNLGRGLGLLKSDHGFVGDSRTSKYVEMYARDQNLFFKDFATAMQKLSLVGIKAGRDGEIRRRCDAFN